MTGRMLSISLPSVFPSTVKHAAYGQAAAMEYLGRDRGSFHLFVSKELMDGANYHEVSRKE